MAHHLLGNHVVLEMLGAEALQLRRVELIGRPGVNISVDRLAEQPIGDTDHGNLLDAGGAVQHLLDLAPSVGWRPPDHD